MAFRWSAAKESMVMATGTGSTINCYVYAVNGITLGTGDYGSPLTISSSGEVYAGSQDSPGVFIYGHPTQVLINAGFIAGGLGGAATAALMVILMIATCLAALREPHPGGFPTSRLFLSVNLVLAIEFSIIIALAIRYRSRPDWHKRLIHLSLVPLLPPGLARWPGVFGPPLFNCDLIIIAGCVYDAITRRRIHIV